MIPNLIRRVTSFHPLIFLIVLCGVAYLPFTSGGVLTDDLLHLSRQLSKPTFREVISTPDPFHFYRPVVQASFWVNTQLTGFSPMGFRLVNLALHISCVTGVYLFARKLGLDRGAAMLGTLAFALTPKAHPIAVLWISARGDLLMSIFALLALLSWVEWCESNRTRWYIVSLISYVCAALSKETALLLPLLLVITPPACQQVRLRRVRGILPMLIAGGALVALRGHLGALMPTTLDAHYSLIRPAFRWIRNWENYLGRVVPSALGLVAIVGIPLWRRHRVPAGSDRRTLHRYIIFAIVWFLVFIGPVLPIMPRSELYLYFPGVGLCFLVGVALGILIRRSDFRLVASCLSVYILIFGAYQASRSYMLHQDLVFSDKLMSSLRAALEGYTGPVVVSPVDAVTAQFLADAVGGYGDIMLKMATGRQGVNGFVNYASAVTQPGVLHLHCAYRSGLVVLSRAGSQ